MILSYLRNSFRHRRSVDRMSEDSRRELAEFLRTRRARITPDSVGLPVGPRRRTAGLRREEVAVLAGLSPTWYAYLEQGRDIHPSPQVLDSLARVLQLTDDERRYVHTLADNVDPAPLIGDLVAEELVRQLVSTADDSPYPVYGTNLYCDVIAWNHAATDYYTDFGRLPEPERNMMRWLLRSPEAKQRLPDWGSDTRDIVARWRAMAAVHEGDSRLQAMVEDFRRTSAEFGPWWDEHYVQEHRSRPRRFHHPQHGEEIMRLIVVRAPEFSPCIVAFHIPLDAGES